MSKDDYCSTVRRWTRLRSKLDGMKKDPMLGSARILLTQHLAGVQEAKRQQQNLLVESRKATLDLNQKLTAAREVVSRIHHLLKAILGPRNERLIDLGVPIGVPHRKKAQPAEGGKAAPPVTTPTAKS